ncbi:hypothetical protein BFS06_12310 [Clostridium perfringens]|uniref:Putative transcriptional regulator n=1 Tax=Clostridium perfringens TaxID=1502 RepID=A0A140GR29_CLOPF|nr:helix-turn-helix transcriptional regulator [Clostridium perfringens]AMN30988.1 putative transcriptional regulator [Clostridium perfringens]TBX14984.1 hypothetical protein BFS06_12310 [Clostridium perfringens]
MKNLGEYLKDLRVNKGVSLLQVENDTNISASYISRLENNKRNEPAPSICYKLASYYGVDVEDIFKHAGLPINISKSEVLKETKFLNKENFEETVRIIDELICKAKSLDTDSIDSILKFANYIKENVK